MECLQGDSESGPSFQHSYVTAWLQLSSLPLRKGQGPSQEATPGREESAPPAPRAAKRWVAGPGGEARFLDANGLQHAPLVVVKVA